MQWFSHLRRSSGLVSCSPSVIYVYRRHSSYISAVSHNQPIQILLQMSSPRRNRTIIQSRVHHTPLCKSPLARWLLPKSVLDLIGCADWSHFVSPLLPLIHPAQRGSLIGEQNRNQMSSFTDCLFWLRSPVRFILVFAGPCLTLAQMLVPRHWLWRGQGDTQSQTEGLSWQTELWWILIGDVSVKHVPTLFRWA